MHLAFVQWTACGNLSVASQRARGLEGASFGGSRLLESTFHSIKLLGKHLLKNSLLCAKNSARHFHVILMLNPPVVMNMYIYKYVPRNKLRGWTVKQKNDTEPNALVAGARPGKGPGESRSAHTRCSELRGLPSICQPLSAELLLCDFRGPAPALVEAGQSKTCSRRPGGGPELRPESEGHLRAQCLLLGGSET